MVDTVLLVEGQSVLLRTGLEQKSRADPNRDFLAYSENSLRSTRPPAFANGPCNSAWVFLQRVCH